MSVFLPPDLRSQEMQGQRGSESSTWAPLLCAPPTTSWVMAAGAGVVVEVEVEVEVERCAGRRGCASLHASDARCAEATRLGGHTVPVRRLPSSLQVAAHGNNFSSRVTLTCPSGWMMRSRLWGSRLLSQSVRSSIRSKSSLKRVSGSACPRGQGHSCKW